MYPGFRGLGIGSIWISSMTLPVVTKEVVENGSEVILSEDVTSTEAEVTSTKEEEVTSAWEVKTTVEEVTGDKVTGEVVSEPEVTEDEVIGGEVVIEDDVIGDEVIGELRSYCRRSNRRACKWRWSNCITRVCIFITLNKLKFESEIITISPAEQGIPGLWQTPFPSQYSTPVQKAPSLFK